MLRISKRLSGRALALPLLLLAALGCQKPETALRERPAQRLELVLKVDGVTPEEEQALAGQLAQGLGLPAVPPEGALRVFRLSLEGKRNPFEERSLTESWAATAGEGAAVGALTPMMFGGHLGVVVMPVGAVVGLVGGVAYGPARFKRHQAMLQEMGYLPWEFWSELQVLERPAPGEERVVAHASRVYVDIRPFLKPLPAEVRTGAAGRTAARAASLWAYGEALLKHLRK
jgi:hypothetical protein